MRSRTACSQPRQLARHELAQGREQAIHFLGGVVMRHADAQRAAMLFQPSRSISVSA